MVLCSKLFLMFLEIYFFCLHFQIFKNLQYSHKNLSKGSCESLCVLDLEAYLCAAVYQSKLMIEIKSNINSRNDSVLSYPPDIIDALCTAIQASWWKAAYGLYTASIKYVYFFPLITLFSLSLSFCF